MHYDLIVIGMGLSGLMAAKTAVENDWKVLIIGKGTGSLCLFSNTIDLLGRLPEGMTMKEGLPQWIKGYPEHPYSKVGPERIDEALCSFLSLFPPPYAFQAEGDRNCLIPTGAGTLRPTYLLPATMVAGTCLRPEDVLLIGFKGFKDFYANYVADQLNCRGVTLPLPKAMDQEVTAAALSRWMEERSFREIIGKEIKGKIRGETRVGLPAILGMRDPVSVKKDLEEMTGARVFEIPILPPSIPGTRIFNRFREWLIQKGVTFLLGHSASKAVLKGKRCEKIEVLHPPLSTSYSSARYVVATGRFLGGGLVATEKRIYEPLLGLPVSQPGAREDWFRKTFFNELSHPLHRAGILTDSSLRPIDLEGNLALENVWVAGSILAHHNPIDEKSREGIEIVTGYMAAKNAIGSFGK
jgi:glycerol-3-phosphate dehydrogenase subunit B